MVGVFVFENLRKEKKFFATFGRGFSKH